MQYRFDDFADKRSIRVDALKYDKTVHRSWTCRVVEEIAELYVLIGVFVNEVKHPLLGHIKPGTTSLEYYWKNRWYNVFKFYAPDNTFRYYYCNVNTPPEMRGDVLSYVDLEIDVLVQPDLSYQILDLDEFETNSRAHNYSPQIIARAQASLHEIIELIETRNFPFDDSPI